MVLFGKRLGAAREGDLAGRVRALEEHVRYMQERLEWYAAAAEKRETEEKRNGTKTQG